jgi:hypothetical protein
MPDPSAVTPPEPAEPNPVGAVVSKAPGDLTDELEVVVESRTGPHRAERIRYWMPRGDVLPSAGDPALVAFDEDGEPWLVAFSPSAP